MGEGIVRAGNDTMADSDHPNKYRGARKRLDVISGSSYVYVYLRSPAPKGATILAAYLRARVRGDSYSGSRTLTVRPLSAGFSGWTTWSNRPGVRTAAGLAASAVVGASVGGDLIEWNVTTAVQQIANGVNHYGWRLESNSGTRFGVRSFETAFASWELEVEWSDAPDQPVGLSPASGAVSVAKPVLSFDYADVSGDTELGSIQVQIDPSANESSPAFDTGELAATVPELDLSSTSYPGLATGASTQWRVRAKDASGLWSVWSDWVTFNRVAKPTVTINNPSSGVVWDSTPDILASSSTEIEAYRVRVTAGDDKTKVLYNSGKQPGDGGDDLAWGIPLRNQAGNVILPDEATRWLNVQVWDTTDREATPGDPAYVDVWTQFTVDTDAATTPVSTITATQVGDSPIVAITWTRGSAADSWELLVDGKVVEKWDNEDIDVDGSTFSATYLGLSPWEPHTIRVRPVVNGKAAAGNPAVTGFVLRVEGVWLVREDGTMLQLRSVDVSGWVMTDRRLTFKPVNSPVDVDIITQLEGVSGPIAGHFTEGIGAVAYDDAKTVAMAIKDTPTETLTLVAADLCIPVKLRNLTVVPDQEFRDGQRRTHVSCEFFQVGDIGYGVD